MAVDDGAHDVDEAHVGGEVDDAEQALELLQRHDDGGAAHEARQRRLRQEVDDEAQPAIYADAWNGRACVMSCSALLCRASQWNSVGWFRMAPEESQGRL